MVGAFIGMWISYGIMGHYESWVLSPKDPDIAPYVVFTTDLVFSIIFSTVYMHIKTKKTEPSEDLGMKCLAMTLV